MNDSKISVRYAKALFESASDRSNLDEVRKDMAQLRALCKMEEFQYFLLSPVIKGSQKYSVMGEILKNNAQPLTLSLLELVCRNSRELYIPGIARNFEDLYKKHKGIKSVMLMGAESFDSGVRERFEILLKESLKAQIDMSVKVNKELIGGFVIRIDDLQYDASVASKLSEIRKELLN